MLIQGIVVVGVVLKLQVDFPALRRLRNAHLHGRCWKPVRSNRFSNEIHTGLVWGATALFLVTRLTGGHDVFPGFIAALNDRHDVIESEVIFLETASAVLAFLVIADKDVGS